MQLGYSELQNLRQVGQSDDVIDCGLYPPFLEVGFLELLYFCSGGFDLSLRSPRGSVYHRAFERMALLVGEILASDGLKAFEVLVVIVIVIRVAKSANRVLVPKRLAGGFHEALLLSCFVEVSINRRAGDLR